MPTTQVGTHTVYYDEAGAGHPVLLLSGLGASRLGWWKQVEPLSKSYRVIAMDNCDAGDSSLATGPYTIADLADHAAGVIRNLKLGPTHVVGISMGGFIAQELALRHPALVARLVLVSTSAGGASHVRAAPEIAGLLRRVEGEDLSARARRIASMTTGPAWQRDHPEDLDRIVRNGTAKPMSPEAYQRQLSAAQSHATADRLAQISLPTLIIHGDFDPLIPYGNGQFLAAHIEGAKLSTYVGVGHLPPIEATPRFTREVAGFLANERVESAPSTKMRSLAEGYTAAWSSQNAASVAEFYAPVGSLRINDDVPAVGRAAITAAAQGFMTAFPDMRVIMDDLVEQADRIVYRWTLVGTNSGPGGTGHCVRISGFEEWTIGVDGLIADSQGHYDAAEYQRQLERGVEAPR